MQMSCVETAESTFYSNEKHLKTGRRDKKQMLSGSTGEDTSHIFCGRGEKYIRAGAGGREGDR